MSDANRRIEALAREFVQKLQEIARDELVRILSTNMGVGSRDAGRPSKPRGPDKKSRSSKRSDRDLVALQDRFLEFIRDNAGLRIEEINKQLGTKTAELALPIKRLLDEGAIKRVGERRSTKYYAVDHEHAKAAHKSRKAAESSASARS